MSSQVYTMELTPSGWCSISEPEQADLHGVACIKGRWATANKENWTHNRIVYVPIAHIKTITVFDSLDDYYESGKRSRLADFPKGESPRQP